MDSLISDPLTIPQKPGCRGWQRGVAFAAVSKSRQTIVTVQYLRAAAATLVVFYHAVGMADRGYLPQIGAFGVDIFFVISGFIMWTTTSKGMSATTFALHRLLRVVPIYWLLTVLFFLARGSATAPELLKSLAFIPYLSPKTGYINPIVAVGWTLNFEMLFYAIFTIALAIRHRAMIIFSSLLLMVGAGFFIHDPSPLLAVYTSPLLLEFIAGCCVGILFERGLLPGLAISSGLLLTGAALILWQHSNAENFGPDRVLAWGAPAALIAAGAIGLERKTPRLALVLLAGDASYSIYLIHSVVLVGLKVAVDRMGLQPGITILVGLAFSVAAGIAMFLAVEKPLTMFLRRLNRPDKPLLATTEKGQSVTHPRAANRKVLP
jgi:exopolysaccharide production protein ExoZ